MAVIADTPKHPWAAMVLMSAVMPAPEDGSNPAIVRTTGEPSAIAAIYRKRGKVPKSLKSLERLAAKRRKIAAQGERAWFSHVHPGFRENPTKPQGGESTFGTFLFRPCRAKSPAILPDRKSTRLNSSHIPLSRM